MKFQKPIKAGYDLFGKTKKLDKSNNSILLHKIRIICLRSIRASGDMYLKTKLEEIRMDNDFDPVLLNIIF